LAVEYIKNAESAGNVMLFTPVSARLLDTSAAQLCYMYYRSDAGGV
jgi:hypothetical protein